MRPACRTARPTSWQTWGWADMGVVTLVLCPTLQGDAAPLPWREVEATLRAWGLPVVAPHPESHDEAEPRDDRMVMANWVAEQAVAIATAHVDTPLILVSGGEANVALPALGFAQRAARKSVVGYVMVDGPLPEPGRGNADWPDAPVIYIQSPHATPESATAARLRGWTTVHRDPADTILEIARGWPDVSL